MTKVNLVRVAHNGQGLAIMALMSGEVQVSFAVAASVQAHIRPGHLRASAVCRAISSVLCPDVPTVAATLPGFEAVSPSSNG